MKDYQGPPSTSLRNDDLARPFGTTNRTLPPGLGAVVSDGSASPGVDGPWSLAGRLRVEAEIIGQLTVLAVITKPVSAAGDAATLVDAIGEMGAAGAIFLTDVDADRARQTQRAVADGGGPVVLACTPARHQWTNDHRNADLSIRGPETRRGFRSHE